jgi:hypothetical protein
MDGDPIEDEQELIADSVPNQINNPEIVQSNELENPP